jgi:hypothetical protein
MTLLLPAPGPTLAASIRLHSPAYSVVGERLWDALYVAALALMDTGEVGAGAVVRGRGVGRDRGGVRGHGWPPLTSEDLLAGGSGGGVFLRVGTRPHLWRRSRPVA